MQTTIKWWQAFNPAIYLISILPAIAVIVLAGEAPVWKQGLLFSTLAVVLLQHAINLFNDVSDWNLGADTEKMDSWVRVHNGNTRPVTIHAIISFVSGGIIGLSVLIVGDKLWIIIIALPLITIKLVKSKFQHVMTMTKREIIRLVNQIIDILPARYVGTRLKSKSIVGI